MTSRACLMLILGVALAACSDKPADQETQPTAMPAPALEAAATTQAPLEEIDPCALVTDEKVSQVLGKTVHGELRPSGAQCSWHADGADKEDFFLTVMDFRKAPQFAEKRFNNGNAPEVPGFGKRAYWEKPPLGSGIVLSVLLDGFVVHIGSSTSEDKAPLQALAPEVLAGLE